MHSDHAYDSAICATALDLSAFHLQPARRLHAYDPNGVNHPYAMLFFKQVILLLDQGSEVTPFLEPA